MGSCQNGTAPVFHWAINLITHWMILLIWWSMENCQFRRLLPKRGQQKLRYLTMCTRIMWRYVKCNETVAYTDCVIGVVYDFNHRKRSNKICREFVLEGCKASAIEFILIVFVSSIYHKSFLASLLLSREFLSFASNVASGMRYFNSCK